MIQTHDDIISYLDADGYRLAYAATGLDGKKPVIVFLHGHGSDMDGTKALAVAEWAEKQEFGCIRFDYFGHGRSGGRMLDGTISRWRDDVLLVLDRLVETDCYLVGSSLGGWLMLLAAVARPRHIRGIVGIAAAPDFTETLIWQELTPEQREKMQSDGQIALPNPYSDEDVVFPYGLIVDGRDNLVLGKPLAIGCPVRLLHGMKDMEVPWQTAQAIADAIGRGATGHDDVQVLLDAEAGHRYSEPDQIDTILATLAEITRQDKSNQDLSPAS